MHRSYDFRLKEAIIESGNPNLFPTLKIPCSTAKGWIRNGISDVVTIPEASFDRSKLLAENQTLKTELEKAKAKFELSWKTFRVFGFQIQYARIESLDQKQLLVDTINRIKTILTLHTCLELIGLSSARFHFWVKNLMNCELSETVGCSRVNLSRLTTLERNKIREYLCDSRFYHFSITSLAIYAKRAGDVFASPITWRRLSKLWKVRRSRKRIYPSKPKIGIRADGPSKIWHLDLTIIRLRDNTKVYMQSVVDNFSRYVLAFKASIDYGGIRTKALLEEALHRANELGHRSKPMVVTDKGSENVNEVVSTLAPARFDHVLAQIDIKHSNSMVESFFRKLKNSYLYFQDLISLDAVDGSVAFFVSEHNEVIPLEALKGATPLESFTSRWSDDDCQLLSEQHREAIELRIASNKGLRCGVC